MSLTSLAPGRIARKAGRARGADFDGCGAQPTGCGARGEQSPIKAPGAGMFVSVSDYNYPEDEFDVSEDEGPVPVGVHRAQVPRWRSWLPLLAVIIIVPALAWGAVSLLRYTGAADSTADSAASQAPAQDQNQDSGQDQAPGAAQTPSAEGTQPSTSGPADLTLQVTVLNGTEISGLAGRTGDRLTNGGFTSVTVPQGIYDGAEPQTSAVLYSSAEYKATAEEVGKQLGIDNVVEDPANAQSSPIVVVLREDFSE